MTDERLAHIVLHNIIKMLKSSLALRFHLQFSSEVLYNISKMAKTIEFVSAGGFFAAQLFRQRNLSQI